MIANNAANTLPVSPANKERLFRKDIKISLDIKIAVALLMLLRMNCNKKIALKSDNACFMDIRPNTFPAS
ncbi:hypothetical protein ACFPLB_01195 [Aquamicrobium segne]|uniref:Uncharacterized protein n=1 Tax=Aquamicrobium segne TaxID=469547 RepID=A0ABW0GSG9_9HYPH